MENQRPKIGVAVIVTKDNKVLMGKRMNAHGDGKWAFPGGHLEFFESVEDCAVREAKEETGLDIQNISKKIYTEDMFEEEEKHYITLFVTAEALPGEPKVMEPEKCAAWEWHTWENLPKPVFLPIENLLGSGFSPFDSK